VRTRRREKLLVRDGDDGARARGVLYQTLPRAEGTVLVSV
jgi:hypothetical protein